MGRKIWLGVIVGGGLFFSFLALLVVGTYSAAAGLVGSSRGAVGLAKGAVPNVYQALVQDWGNLCPALNPALLAAQLYQESGWNPRAQSGADAQGIAQFIPGTWATHGLDANHDGTADVWDPEDAIPSAAQYDCDLASYVKNVPGDNTDNMLAAYNAGAYAVIQAGGVPPYRETQNYVKRIRTLEKSFAAPVGAVAPSQQAAGAIYFAQQRLGTPYLWGGEGTAAQGGRFDCSGLTQAAYASVGITLPRVANDQWNAGPHPARADLLPGDLVFFATDLDDPRSIHHVGIYVGGGYMIDAPHTGAVIRFDPVDSADYIGATRVTQAGAQALPTQPAQPAV
ncbi:C40 family peptidase [Actinacidiphila epipremni]|jgi:cell wall-associated NlpC family hydrolase|uniref:Transglycosylase SLT domain-containing protein n=1 Tax=Actinacidiphila epipremni TaxID=2053013 RepID=A0ABX0ZWE6_9ACTN|nr:bifunctional lytic transglycosylase/C40 family peptidase [Actinacidiphila epipremni]NJP46992.1 transglycosylase SLT domain-containing protein [Actinacidiphila epipremni]